MTCRKGLLSFLVASISTGALLASGAPPAHVVFREVSAAGFSADRPRDLFPSAFRTMVLDEDALRAALHAVPAEADYAAGEPAPSLALLTPDGVVSEFAVMEAPVMDGELARKFPEIRTFRGQGLTDRAETLILDVSPAGLHAMILSPRGTILIDPASPAGGTHYIVYFKRHAQRPQEPFSCQSQDTPGHDAVFDGTVFKDSAPHVSRLLSSGQTLRTYRTAIAVTGEYSAAVCAPAAASVSCALPAVVTVLNRVDGILERDAAVRLVLVANESLLIYTNPSTDPYTNSDLNRMLTENRDNLNAVLGNSNFDFGHVFGTAGGGTAYISVACDSTYKAQGVTSLSHPLGDPFAVDYVAHEMGHQLGAHHSFNGTTDGCMFRDGPYAYEPGSGSTLMSYAGLCGSEMLQLHHDDYYHAKSLDLIQTFLGAAGSSCGTATATGNAPPVVSTSPSYTIPMRTPFTLTGSATDANGDALTFAWEETDLGSPAPPNDDVAAERPIFRSFPPASTPARTFPRISDILGNTSTLGESLPTRMRNMTFRLTVRDNRSGGGGVGSASTTVAVTAGAGPFIVTSPNSAVTWPALSDQTVTWNVANTNASPIGCASVSIFASTDGGLTFPLILASSVANDGSAIVTMPFLQTTTARVKVACATNIFFDLSNTNFAISGGAPASADFYTVAPCRILDTRTPGGPTGGLPLSSGDLVSFNVGGNCGIPVLARAVSANVTVTQPTGEGNFKVFPGDNIVPIATTLSFSAGQTRANNAILSLSQDGEGTINVKSDFSGSAHLIIDVNGFFQ